MSDKSKHSTRAKKQLTPKQQKAMTILNWVATAVCIVVIVYALVVAIFTIAGASDENHLTRFGNRVYMNVATDSMAPTFSSDDVILADYFDYNTQGDTLKVGQVITYKTIRGIARVLNTHRIVKINYDKSGAIVSVITRGDNNTHSWQEAAAELAKPSGEWQDAEIIGQRDSDSVLLKDIVATWGTVNEDGTFTDGKMLKGVGGFSNWIQDTDGNGASAKIRFFCVVVLPLILLFVVYAFVLIRTLVVAKLENERKVQAEQALTVDGMSDEEKRRLAQELLASLNADASASQADESQNGEEPVAEPTSEEPTPKEDNSDSEN